MERTGNDQGFLVRSMIFRVDSIDLCWHDQLLTTRRGCAGEELMVK
jgi:hypothetical protein